MGKGRLKKRWARNNQGVHTRKNRRETGEQHRRASRGRNGGELEHSTKSEPTRFDSGVGAPKIVRGKGGSTERHKCSFGVLDLLNAAFWSISSSGDGVTAKGYRHRRGLKRKPASVGAGPTL